MKDGHGDVVNGMQQNWREASDSAAAVMTHLETSLIQISIDVQILLQMHSIVKLFHL